MESIGLSIKTKYNIGNEVWLMWQNMAVTAIVKRMRVEIGDRGVDCYCYIKNQYFERELHNSHIYPTKEELLKSL